MAWNDYLVENGWNTPRFPNTHVVKSDIEYAASYADLDFNMTMATDENYLFDISNFRVVNDNRHPIFLIGFDNTGEIMQTLNPIAPLYSALYEYHGYYGGESHDDDDAEAAYYPLDSMGNAGTSPFDYPTHLTQCDIETNIPIIGYDMQYVSAEQIDMNALRANYLNNGDLSIFDEYRWNR